MNLRQIQELIKFVAKSGATEVDLEIGDVKLSIKSPPKGKAVIPEVIPNQYLPPIQTPPVQVQQASIQSTPPVQSIEPVKEQISQDAGAETQDESNYITFKAPIIGTFYRRPSPEKDAFVSVGDTVSEGSVLCIIEAMKLFNEIESEVSGKIVKVLVDDMSPVEYNQPLFLIDPS
ncbi:MAG: acetyl-CoA carboxylase, biotin carboxyl carrier protein [Flavobacteriales bacterium]|nr:acetyl-CoA carboxylase, biotin carboxyl carrier protein [Flavobacteriales bacterium]|tara:strand:- start:3510 stop:4034 length:525 start_codon:yes stop_codon:yes gene_type:complete